MPDFQRPSGVLSIAEIAKLTGATLPAGEASDRRIANIAALADAGPGDISFIDDEKDRGELAVSHAGACLMTGNFAAAAPPGLVALVTAEPYRTFVLVARALFPAALRASSMFEGSAPPASAIVHASARIEAGVTIDPLAMIGPRAEIGTGTLISAGAVIGPGVRIGRHCVIGAGVTIQHALLGDRVTVGPGARIGQEGVAHLPGPGGRLKVPHVRRVILQDEVEIGANATIDRGTTRDTVIGEGSKIDNLVRIAHNVTVGRHCLITSPLGMEAGAVVGDFVQLAARSGEGNVA